MRFILQQKHIISGITTYIFALFLCLAMISTARANVCFLPDDVDCAEGNTEGFWPGADSNPNACDSSFNSTSSRNVCGEACEKCNDSNSPYYGLYKCPRPTCNCNGFNSTEPTNECGDSCERCTITGDRNYGKYKCPDVRRVCDDCEYTEEQAKLKMEQNSCFVCEPCNSNCCLGKWRCSEDRDCGWCQKNGYTSETDIAAEQERNGECVNQRCEPCPKNPNLFKCTPLSGQCNPSYYQYSENTLSSYTQTQINNHCDEECGICFDPRYGYKHCTCFGYDKREADCTREGLIGLNPCNGHNGKWFEKCCSACSGYTYERDMSDTPGCSCTKCENACPDVTKKWKCICKEQCDSSFDKTSPKTGDGWKCDKCSDVNGDHYKCVCKEGYELKNGDCVKPGCPEGSFMYKGECINCDTCKNLVETTGGTSNNGYTPNRCRTASLCQQDKERIESTYHCACSCSEGYKYGCLVHYNLECPTCNFQTPAEGYGELLDDELTELCETNCPITPVEEPNCPKGEQAFGGMCYSVTEVLKNGQVTGNGFGFSLPSDDVYYPEVDETEGGRICFKVVSSEAVDYNRDVSVDITWRGTSDFEHKNEPCILGYENSATQEPSMANYMCSPEVLSRVGYYATGRCYEEDDDYYGSYNSCTVTKIQNLCLNSGATIISLDKLNYSEWSTSSVVTISAGDTSGQGCVTRQATCAYDLQGTVTDVHISTY